MHEAWFADEERVRKAVGLLEEPVIWFPNYREVSYLDIHCDSLDQMLLLLCMCLFVCLCFFFFLLSVPYIDHAIL